MSSTQIRKSKSGVSFEQDEDPVRTAIFNRMKQQSKQSNSFRCYVLPSKVLGIVTTRSITENVIVVPMPGVNPSRIDSGHSRIFADVHPRLDGTRIACLMLANEVVALTINAPHCADASLGDDFLVLWVFDSDVLGSIYSITDDVNESMWIASAIEEDHNPLTQAEVEAWCLVARESRHIVVSEVIDLNREEDRRAFESFETA